MAKLQGNDGMSLAKKSKKWEKRFSWLPLEFGFSKLGRR